MLNWHTCRKYILATTAFSLYKSQNVLHLRYDYTLLSHMATTQAKIGQRNPFYTYPSVQEHLTWEQVSTATSESWWRWPSMLQDDTVR